MERINSAGSSRLKSNLKSKKGRLEKKKASGTVSSGETGKDIREFTEIFSLENVDIDNEHLEDLLDEIHQSGDALKELPTLDRIKKYRQSVSNFMKYVVKNTLDTDTAVSSSFNPLKKQKRYIIIKIVDENLDQLAAGILQNQLDQLQILEKIDEINGLIVDLLK